MPGFGDVLNTRFRQRTPEFLGARCSVPGDMKGGQVGFSKCSSEMLISGRKCTPVESYGPNLIRAIPPHVFCLVI